MRTDPRIDDLAAASGTRPPLPPRDVMSTGAGGDNGIAKM
jgi:hypothetical protein